VRTKKGNQLHSKGDKLPFSDVEARPPIGYARAVGEALRGDAIAGGISAKVIMRWTGASERSVKGWISGRQGPSGEHLMSLMQRSDAVWEAVQRLAGRRPASFSQAIEAARQHLIEADRALAELGGETSALSLRRRPPR
jgi:hypothetical protein